MGKKWYAGDSYYSTNVTYDSGGWTVHVFDSKEARDRWVDEDPSELQNHRCALSAKDAEKIAPAARYDFDGREYH